MGGNIRPWGCFLFNDISAYKVTDRQSQTLSRLGDLTVFQGTSMLVVANLSDQLLNKLQLWTENGNKSGMNLKRGLQKQIDIREFLPKVEFYITGTVIFRSRAAAMDLKSQQKTGHISREAYVCNFNEQTSHHQ